MSFILDIEVPDLTPEQAGAIAADVRARGAWPVSVQNKGLFRRQPQLWAPSDVDGEHLLTDNAGWDEPSWDMNPKLLPRLAETVRVLGEHLSQGFFFRATWVSDPIRDEREMTPEELAELVLSSKLNEYTRYRISGASSAGDV